MISKNREGRPTGANIVEGLLKVETIEKKKTRKLQQQDGTREGNRFEHLVLPTH